MDEPRGSGDGALRWAWSFAVAYLLLSLPARMAIADYRVGSAGVIITVGLFVLPLLFALPRTRGIWVRRRSLLLSVQAALTVLPFALFGGDWVMGLSGLLAGLLLLTLRPPTSWVLAAVVVALEGLRGFVLGVPDTPGEPPAFLVVWPVTVAVNMALGMFGLVRLADMVAELHAARASFAANASARQRLSAAHRLREAVDQRLESVAAQVQSARAALGVDLEQTGRHLATAAAVARQALAQVRGSAMSDERREPDGYTGGIAGRDRLAPRVARWTLLGVLAAFLVAALLPLFISGLTAPTVLGATAAVLTMALLQLRHSLGTSPSRRPTGWRWTLAAQATLGPASMWIFDTVNLVGLAGFAAGSALQLLTGRAAWAAFTITSLAAGASVAAHGSATTSYTVYIAALVAATGLMIYGLTRLAGLAAHVETARDELARAAALHERVRITRDTHDLLGLGLSAIALKCDLAARLAGRDPDHAGREIDELTALAVQARADLAAVLDDRPAGLTILKELESARAALTPRGVVLDADVTTVPLPPVVDSVLATVLRESVTNMLRHATPSRCSVRVTTDGTHVRMQVGNDGAGQVAQGDPGTGIGNLHGRVRALGGDLAAAPAGADRFDVELVLPVLRSVTHTPSPDRPR
jgi:two-component system, NarL family, sensor histidine kinase DesK